MQLLTRSDVCAKLSISEPTLWRLRKHDPTFPEPQYLRPRAPRWDAREIEAWAESKRGVETPTLRGYRPEFMPRGKPRPPNDRKKTS